MEGYILMWYHNEVDWVMVNIRMESRVKKLENSVAGIRDFIEWIRSSMTIRRTTMMKGSSSKVTKVEGLMPLG